MPYEDQRFDKSLDQFRKSISRTMICVPLSRGGQGLGCLEISNKRGGPFEESDFDLAVMISKEIEIGLSLQTLPFTFQDFRKEQEEFRSKVAQISNENLLGPLLKSELIILTDMIKAEKVMLYIKSEQEDTIVLSEVSSTGLSADPVALDIHAGCAGQAFRTKEIVFEPLAQSSTAISKQEVDPAIVNTTVHNLIAVPIFDEKGNSIGVFEIMNSDKSHFTGTTTKLLLVKFAKYISLLFYTNSLLKNTVESYEILSIALDSVNDGIMLVDNNGNVTTTNNVMKMLLKQDEDHILGWKLSEVLKRNSQLLSYFFELIEYKESQHQLNTWIAASDGEKFTINFHCIFVNTSKGKTGNILLVFQPIQTS